LHLLESHSLFGRVEDSAGGFVSSLYINLNLLARRDPTAAGSKELRIDETYTTRNQIDTITRSDDIAGLTKIGTSKYTYDDARLANINHKNGARTSLASYVIPTTPAGACRRKRSAPAPSPRMRTVRHRQPTRQRRHDELDLRCRRQPHERRRLSRPSATSIRPCMQFETEIKSS
jgi:hypothetical protein